MRDGEALSVIHIVWSPRRIEQSLRAHEALGLPTAFITGYNEHEGCQVANRIIEETDADVYVLSYDDQCPTPYQLDLVLEFQRATGDVVSGWQLLGQDSIYGSATHPSWGLKHLKIVPACFYTAEELRASSDVLIPSHYFAALTAIPRELLIESPLWALPHHVKGRELGIYPSRDGQPYDKGCCSDWTIATDFIRNGHRIHIVRDAEVLHLAPQHGVPAHKFYVAEDEPGVWWDHRPRNADEFAEALV